MSIWKLLHSDEKSGDKFDELFPELYGKLKEALEDMAASDPDFEVQTQARIVLNLIQPQKDPLDYGDHYRRLAERENRLWERLDEYKEEYDRRSRKLNDSNSSESTAGFIESYAQDERPRTSSVKAIASNIQALFNNRRSPQTQKTPKAGRGGFKFVVSSVPESERSPPTYKPPSNRSPDTERRQTNLKNDYSIDAHFVIPSIIEDEQGSSAFNQSPVSALEDEQSPLLNEPLTDASGGEYRQSSPELPYEFSEASDFPVKDDDVVQLADEENDKSLDALISEIENYSSKEPSRHSTEIGEDRENTKVPEEESTSAVDDLLFEIVDEVEKSLDTPVSAAPESDQSPVHEPLLDHSSEEINQKQETLGLLNPESISDIDDNLVDSSSVVIEESYDAQPIISPVPKNTEYFSIPEPSSDVSPDTNLKDLKVSEEEHSATLDNGLLESVSRNEKSVDVPIILVSEDESSSPTLSPPEIENEKSPELPEPESASVVDGVALESTDEKRNKSVDPSIAPVSEDERSSFPNYSSEAERKQTGLESNSSSAADSAASKSNDEGNDESPNAQSPPILNQTVELNN